METVGNSGQLTNNQIVRLAAAISANNMESIAGGYMDINDETIKNKKYENKDDAEAFNREIIRYWMNMNPDNQQEKLACILNQAAQECGNLDQRKVQKVLGVSKQETSAVRNTPVTEDDLLNLAEDLRPHTAKGMKMEPAPWIKDYVVDMEELYTELTLEKINGHLDGQERKKLENYKELFTLNKPGMLEYLDIRYYCPNLIPKTKTKVLIKAGPGMGKTSLVKKIAWDWAKRIFVKVSIVFFVFLKLVKPGDLIENAIIQQTHVLQGKHVTKRKLTDLLQKFGHECLIILDGFDECALGQNSDVLKVITESKFINCNILLTSRPHSTRQFERYFDVIVRVEGFTHDEARKFALRIVPDQQRVKDVLNFNPAGDRSEHPVHNVPILLSFLCLLIREDNIDLSDKRISVGEIYFRMVQCLYKKFTIRKGIKFKSSSLVTVLKSIGKLAFETLLSGNPLLERSTIIEQVGEDVFDYGLLIGDDGFNFTRDMTVDILVTFPHRSLQEFLGAFYFILTLGQKPTTSHLDKATREYLKNPLFAEFCLWFLDQSNRFFSFPERSLAYDMLSNYVTEQIDKLKVDFCKLVKKYPALTLALGDNRNEIALEIIEGALVKCSRIRVIVAELHHPIDRILRSVHPFIFQRLNSVKISNFQEKRKIFELIPRESPLQFLCVWQDHNFNLTVMCDLSRHLRQSVDALNTVLKVSDGWNRSVYLRVSGGMPGISSQDYPSVHTLSIDSSHYILPLYKTYPQLVNLFLTYCGLDSRYMSHLADANVRGRLPKLSTLDISGNLEIGGNLSMLLSHIFPSLHILILSNCELQMSDVVSLAQARKETRLPQLRHLDLSFNFYLNLVQESHSSRSLLPMLFQQGIPTLNTLVVRNCQLMPDDLHTLYRQVGLNSNFLSELTVLDMSLNITIGGSLWVLMRQHLLHLQILVLRDCELNSDDLISLTQASSQGRLPELRYLDLSQNYIGGEKRGIFRMFRGLKSFPLLINLILCDCHLELQDLCCLTQAKLDGKLPRIRHLDISLNRLSGHVGMLSRDPITQREISWESVICYEYYSDSSSDDD